MVDEWEVRMAADFSSALTDPSPRTPRGTNRDPCHDRSGDRLGPTESRRRTGGSGVGGRGPVSQQESWTFSSAECPPEAAVHCRVPQPAEGPSPRAS